MVKRKVTYPVREPNADDALDLFGILGAAGIDGSAGQAIGIAISAYTHQGDMPAANDVMIRAASEGIMSGLASALRDKQTREDAKEFLFSIWDPKLPLKEGETYNEKKRQQWSELPMDAPIKLIDAFRHTQNFSDFLSFFTDMLPSSSPVTETNSETTTAS